MLRFDFSHFSALSEFEIREIERMVNEIVWQDIPVTIYYTTLENAKQDGAIALFEQAYEERVRVVKIGQVSLELCGGTHLKSTGQIGLFKIISESAIAAGTRRIEALCGKTAYDYVLQLEDERNLISQVLKVAPGEITSRINKMAKDLKAQEKELSNLRNKILQLNMDNLALNAKDVNGIKLLALELESMNPDSLRTAADRFEQKLKEAVVLLACKQKDKVIWISKVSQNLTKRVHAGRLIDRIAKITGGGGGGRENFAQAGGKEVAKIKEAIQKAPEILKDLLKEGKQEL
jgi:alanyl-tRNA synthetase